MSNLALPIAKRIGRSQPEPTLKLGDAGFAVLIQNIRHWISELPATCRLKIFEGKLWPHRCTSADEIESLVALPIHVPATPTGSETAGWGIYQVLCELGDILTMAGFNTHDIGALYDHRALPHLGILLRFGWSNEMRELFNAYQADLEAINRLSEEVVQISEQDSRERAISMWDAI
jgi:hypothetical protein